MITSSANHKALLWGPLSLAIPIVSVALGMVYIAQGSQGPGGDISIPLLTHVAVDRVGEASTLGLLAALVGIIRKEKWFGLSIAGFLLNLPLVILMWL